MKTYRFIQRLVNRITRSGQPLNDCFAYYGYTVTLRSCMRDFVVVAISNGDNELTEFDFDYWTKRLTFDHSASVALTAAIVEAFDDIYDKVKVRYPLPTKYQQLYG